MICHRLTGLTFSSICTCGTGVMAWKTCFTVEAWIVVFCHAWTERSGSNSELGGIASKTLSCIGAGLTLVTASLTQFIGPIIIILGHTLAPYIIRIKNSKFSSITTGASSRIRTQPTCILTRRTSCHFTLIELRFANTFIGIVKCTSRTTCCALGRWGRAIHARVITRWALFNPCIKVALFAGALVSRWVQSAVCRGIACDAFKRLRACCACVITCGTNTSDIEVFVNARTSVWWR